MAALHREHSRSMIDRTGFCLVFAVGLVACAGKTTSLGGSQGNQSSASTTDGGGDNGASSGSIAITPPADSGAGGQMCGWYAWRPVPTTNPCEYLLPSRPYADPGYDPKTWNPHNVRIVLGDKQIHPYAETSEGCAATDGWYYVTPTDGQPPKRFMICPNSCAFVDSDAGAGFLEMDAQSCH
jgi:hypothetical protein